MRRRRLSQPRLRPRLRPQRTTPAPPPAPVVAPKAAGVVRIGVVKIKDMSGQSLPTDSLRLNLMNEISRHQHEAIPLDSRGPARRRGNRSPLQAV